MDVGGITDEENRADTEVIGHPDVRLKDRSPFNLTDGQLGPACALPNEFL
jgi:hypothetical protein